MKAIIPVAGAGTRLRPLTYTQPKPLIPVAGKPIIAFIIDQLIEVGITDFVFIIGYLGEKIKLYVEQAYPDIDKVFVQQNERVGSAHAIWMAREEIKGTDEVIIVFGDTILDLDLSLVLKESHSCFAVKKVDDPREFGVVEFGKDDFVSKVVEKPKIPKSNLAMVGLYKIKEVSQFLDAIDFNINNNIQTHGEFQLTDALMHMVNEGIKFTTITVDNWYDCGKKEILLRTNAMLLSKKGYASSQLPNYDNSIIIHPVSIGKNCEITNSIIGPHVTIGDNVNINYSIIKESIIGNYSAIDEVILNYSVVGSDAAIRGLSQSLNIGDNTEIDFS
jgi:glucose-1-phosphate thymidylyltransferase